ncbi:hypothetical protein [Autumnicola edwardsiae]|jgi:hypothetical protein|uniref:Potassium channel domain-containing protein n=1 Tax=Autumnicola edwardsiae TaxID=3075594 RepID=A0ABU3CYP1_9FLAO|nr:hypothetical protein [Zunongwangia sp. F297]MDT0651312.1 hypothetical protein [Zunongwangia sp. F297]
MIILGISLLIAVSIDIIKTVIFIDGSGTFSKFLAAGIWQIFYFIGGKKGSSKVLTFAGGTILIVLVLFWILMIWGGYSLIFLSDPDSVVDTTTKKPASTIGNIYYVGYTLTSLGNGDLKSGSDFWRIISNIMGISSMFFTTLGISYVLPVLQAVIAKRSLAIYITKLGRTPNQIIKKGWNGKSFSALYDRFTTLENMLLQHSERHLAYPVLHYFHSNYKDYSAPLRLAALDEAITIQEIFELDKTDQAYNWNALRGAMDNYIVRLDNTFTGSPDKAPPFPYENPLNNSTVLENGKEEELRQYQQRRCKLLGLINKDGWEWEDLLS